MSRLRKANFTSKKVTATFGAFRVKDDSFITARKITTSFTETPIEEITKLNIAMKSMAKDVVKKLKVKKTSSVISNLFINSAYADH